MREKLEKETFIKNTKKHIELRNMLSDFYNNVYLPTLKDFDGKVYNIRFIKKLREKAAELTDLAYIKERDYDHIEMQIRMGRYSYTDYESMYFPCVLTSEGRIDYQKTIENTYGIAWYENHEKYTKEMQTTIDRYDEFMKVVEQFQKAIDDWDKLPHSFRQNIEKPYIY